jgi:hypothetical protein
MLHLLWQNSNCPDDNCPAIYETPDGSYVIQGDVIDDATRAELQRLGENEGAVVVPASLIAWIQNQGEA